MKVLVVEDNEDSRLLQSAALSGFGYTVETAGNGREALEQVRAFDPDVIVSDLLMPEMDGFELCRELKSDPALSHIPFIVYTATYADPQDEALALALGAARYVIKPVEPTEFISVIREVLSEAQRHRLAPADGASLDEREFVARHGARVRTKLDRKLQELEAHGQALEQVERDYRLLVESLDDVVFQTDRQLRWTFLNFAWERRMGYTTGESLGCAVVDYVHPDDRVLCRELLDAALREDAQGDTQRCRFLTRAGNTLWFGIRVRAMHAESGRVEGLSGVLRDVTVQQQALMALQSSEEKFRRLVEQASDAILVIDAQSGEIVDANARLEVMTGYPRDALLGQPYTRLHPERMRAAFRKQFQQIVDHGGAVCEALWIQRFDGELVPVEISACVMEWRGRRRVQQIVRDVSQRRNDEEKRRQHAEVFHNAAEGIVITDADQRIVSINPAFTAITGYQENEMLGRTPAMLKSGRHDREFYAAMWEAIATDDRWQGEIWNRRKSGEIYPERLTISAVRDPAGKVVNYIGVFADITQVKEVEARLHHLAHHDALTGLPNRLLFEARLEHAIEQAKRKRGGLGVLFVDLDRFKPINDSAGHAVGDVLLTQVAGRMRERLRDGDTLARIGGDEFTVLLEELNGPREAAIVAGKVLGAFAEPFTVGEREFVLSASIGIGIFPQDGEDAATLLKNTDAAMYRAKQQGNSNYHYYTREMTAIAVERAAIESHLQHALQRNQFRMLYQPLVRLQDMTVVGAEALIRWSNDELGDVAPERFIPLAEESGLIVSIGDWVLESVCRQGREWLDRGMGLQRLAVNLSAQQVRRNDIPKTVQRILQETGFPAERLQLEIAEPLLLEIGDWCNDVLERLARLGVTLALDDFGTGHALLNRLGHLPIQVLKVDRSLIRGVGDDPAGVRLPRAAIALAASLGLRTVAEGVETRAQHRFVLDAGCDDAQGYLYGRPMDAEALAEHLRRGVATVD